VQLFSKKKTIFFSKKLRAFWKKKSKNFQRVLEKKSQNLGMPVRAAAPPVGELLEEKKIQKFPTRLGKKIANFFKIIQFFFGFFLGKKPKAFSKTTRKN
jgi:hypothetical protein